MKVNLTIRIRGNTGEDFIELIGRIISKLKEGCFLWRDILKIEITEDER